MKRIFAFIQISSIFGVLLLMGCAPSVPGKYIQPGEMEDILYDYHIAEAMANDYESRRDTLLMRVYKAAVLKDKALTLISESPNSSIKLRTSALMEADI